MGEQIISASGPQYGLVIDSQGRAKVDATVSVSAGSESYLYGKSGTDWYTLAVESGTDGILRTTASVSVTVGSVEFYERSYNFGSAYDVSSGAESNIISVNFPTGSNFKCVGFDATGTSDAKFILYHNANKVTVLRNNPAQRNVIKGFDYPLQFAGAGSVILKVEHGELLSQDFDGVVYGDII